MKQWVEQTTKQSQEAIIKALLGARDAMLKIRHFMRLMGEAAGVPVYCSLLVQMIACF